ncbi:MAG: carboxypeptidase-like regulatory domain-containing protein, partial [Planctomycetota bacterium]|nr:carboxypeptidase-like regulatory domain-containing protein [Planctomycetota bacterium]
MIARSSLAKWGFGLAISLLVFLVIWTVQREKKPSALEVQRAAETPAPATELPASELQGPGMEPAGREVLAATKLKLSSTNPSAQTASPANTGSLSGKVTLLSGEPLPNVVVYATSTAPPADGITFSALALTDRNGSFEHTGLQPGTFILAVTPNMDESGDWNLPIQGNDLFRTGGESIVLAVDAVVVKVQSPGQENRKHMPDSFRCSRSPAQGVSNEG